MQELLKRSLLFTLLFIVLSNFLVDPDLGWHVAIGEHFLSTGQVIRPDIFSFTMPGYMWGNSYLLYEIAVAFLMKTFGHLFLVFAFSVIGALGFLILVKKLNFVNGFLTLFAAVFAMANLGVRPHMVSLFMFAVLVVLIEKKFFLKLASLPVFFIFFALWANIHRGFVFALMVFALYLFFYTLREKKISLRGAGALLFAFGGSFITPFPVLVWSSGVAGDFTTFENLKYIAEWQPTVMFFPQNLLLAVSGMVFIYLFLNGGRRLDVIWFLVGCIIFALAFISVAFMFFWSAIFVFLITRHFDLKLPRFVVLPARTPLFVYFVLTLSVLAMLLSFSVKVLESINFRQVLVRNRYPVLALEFMKKSGIVGNLFNSYVWGGYLVWQAEGSPVFIDGRMAGWKAANGQSILGEYMKISKGECEPLDKWEIDVVLVEKSFNLKCFSRFGQVYSDEFATVLLKT